MDTSDEGPFLTEKRAMYGTRQILKLLPRRVQFLHVAVDLNEALIDHERETDAEIHGQKVITDTSCGLCHSSLSCEYDQN